MRSQPPTALETSGPFVIHVTGQWLKACPAASVHGPQHQLSRVHTVHADRGPPGSAWRNSPGYPDEEAVSHGAKCSLAFSHVILTSQWAQALHSPHFGDEGTGAWSHGTEAECGPKALRLTLITTILGLGNYHAVLGGQEPGAGSPQPLPRPSSISPLCHACPWFHDIGVCLRHCRQILYCLSHQRRPVVE